jgi:hypothetical protein
LSHGQLLRVEDGPPEGDPLQREAGHELLERELLLVVGHDPAHEGEVVDERLREEPGAR